ncbi:hypothetical protein CCR75_005947 [Bremia lactucae]|uniref:Complex 1 LYR protein domain-containing protein n=1 Tax=Bremia lactucae TaxID=4779 RepID=A0A976ID72_BRELC|nr:hypothetical protein CCR75_005947 [Bremia lactucae]
MAETKEVVRLYRLILKLAHRYPSIKRKAIIHEIKSEFHANKSITDAQKILEEMASVHAGIKELSMYANLHPTQPNWNVEVGRDALQSLQPIYKEVTAKNNGKQTE